MKASQIQELGNVFAEILLSHGAHGLATFSLDGMGEITLRDGLVVAAAAIGARTKQAWILKREVVPQKWKEAKVDLMIYEKKPKQNPGRPKLKIVGGIELKWWKNADGSNSTNRRKELIEDFWRAAALYKDVGEFSLVALLSTADSWKRTTSTKQSDKSVTEMLLKKNGVQKWNLSRLKKSSAVCEAVKVLKKKEIPICDNIHSELLSSCSLQRGKKDLVYARVWSIKKPSKSRFLKPSQVEEFMKK